MAVMAAVRLVAGDELGYVRAMQASTSSLSSLQMVARWGDGTRNAGVTHMSFSSSDGSSPASPLLAVARTSGAVDILDSNSGALLSSAGRDFSPCRGLHFLGPGLGSSTQVLFSCKESGSVRMHCQEGRGAAWEEAVTLQCALQGQAKLDCMAVHPSGTHVAVAGNGADVVVWDVAAQTQVYKAKPPPLDFLGMYKKIWVASLSFLPGHDAQRLVAGDDRQIRVYDFRAQRRAVLSIDFGETLIKALTVTPDASALIAGNAHGLLSKFDLGSGKMLGAFKGISGSVRAISHHPTLPLIAATGLDRHVHLFDSNDRRCLASLYVKQHCTSAAAEGDGQEEDENDDELVPLAEAKARKKKKKKSKASTAEGDVAAANE